MPADTRVPPWTNRLPQLKVKNQVPYGHRPLVHHRGLNLARTRLRYGKTNTLRERGALCSVLQLPCSSSRLA
jgi:hypothetical protein